MSYVVHPDGTVGADTIEEAVALALAFRRARKTPPGYKPQRKRHKWGLATPVGAPGGKHGKMAFACETCGTLKSYNGRGQPIYLLAGQTTWSRGNEWCEIP